MVDSEILPVPPDLPESSPVQPVQPGSTPVQPVTPSNDSKQTKTNQTADPHVAFCKKLGIQHYRVESGRWFNKERKQLEPGDSAQATSLKATKGGYYEEIQWACIYHSWQYWLVASTINILYLTQIVIGATATALGGAGIQSQATQARTTAITILTAIGTVVAGILAFMKSRGQPNRVRQLRNDLRKVQEYIREMEMAFSFPVTTSLTVEQAMEQVKIRYDTARTNAEINYPDTWSTLQKPSGK